MTINLPSCIIHVHCSTLFVLMIVFCWYLCSYHSMFMFHLTCLEVLYFFILFVCIFLSTSLVVTCFYIVLFVWVYKILTSHLFLILSKEEKFIMSLYLFCVLYNFIGKFLGGSLIMLGLCWLNYNAIKHQ